MKSKIAASIISAYESKPPEYVLGPDEIAEIVVKVIMDNLPAEKKSIDDDDLTDIHADITGIPSEYDGWNAYRSELLKLLED